MKKTLAALVLGIGALGAGCTEDNVVEGAKKIARREMVYITEVIENPRALKSVCNQKFPFLETEGFYVYGLNAEDERCYPIKVCCIVERSERYWLFKNIKAGYCSKVKFPSEPESQ